jgi:multiple sugar transport system permease protein/raffinose/stachyose/melibiose transport system permease protein
MAAVSQSKPPVHRSHLLQRAAVYILVAIVIVGFLLPFTWMISTAIKTTAEIFTFPPRVFPNNPTLDNFEVALNPTFLRYGLNSVIVATLTTFVTLFFATLSAYAFSRLHFPGRKLILSLIILTQLLPLAVLIVPMHRIMGGLGLLNTYPALVIAYLTFTVPVAVWFLRGFIAGIPIEIEEAAMIDGCTRLQSFLRVILPLSVPGMTATATYVFVLTWQELMFASAFTVTQDMRTLPIGVLDFIGERTTDWGGLMAASVLVCIPVLILFMFLQRWFIAGLTRGAIKG